MTNRDHADLYDQGGPAAVALYVLMSEWSERCWAAGWYDRAAYALAKQLHEDDGDPFIRTLGWLSEQLGDGWIDYGADGPFIAPLARYAPEEKGT